MSIFDRIFGSASQSQQAVQQNVQQPNQQNTQPQPGNIPPNVTPGSATNVNVPADQNNTNNTNAENKSPLDGFSDLWKDTDTNSTSEQSSSMFNVDPKKLLEAAQKNNFAKIVPNELLSKISAGGEEAQAVLPQILNLVSANTFAQSAQATTRIVEAALAKQAADFESKLPGIIKQQSVSESLKAENPIFKHPAAAPMLDALQERLASKHPDATGAELHSMAKDFLIALSESANPKKAQEAASSQGNQEEDWSKFFG